MPCLYILTFSGLIHYIPVIAVKMVKHMKNISIRVSITLCTNYDIYGPLIGGQIHLYILCYAYQSVLLHVVTTQRAEHELSNKQGNDESLTSSS